MRGVTPFQTAGPFFHVLLRTRRPPAAGEPARARAVLHGVLFDGAGQPIPDGWIDAWHAGAGADGYGWSATDETGRFRFEVIRPGPVPASGGRIQAPHLLLGVLARGILTRYVTRAYFGDEPANESDPILALVPVARRRTLIAEPDGSGGYRLDIRIQGERETVFFDV